MQLFAAYEAISFLVMCLLVEAEVLITTGIVDFNIDLLLLDTLDAPVDIEHCWLVVIRKLIVQEIDDQAGLADGGVTCEHELERLCSCLIRSLSLLSATSSTISTGVRCTLANGSIASHYELVALLTPPLLNLSHPCIINFFDLGLQVLDVFFEIQKQLCLTHLRNFFHCNFRAHCAF